MPKLPSSSNGSPKDSSSELPENLKPYAFHLIDLSYRTGAKHAVATCPFCGSEGKLSIVVENQQFNCPKCNHVPEGKENGKPGGNQYHFIRSLYQHSEKVARESDYEALRKDRKLLSSDVLIAWGIRKSASTSRWIIPGYNEKGEIIQLYQYSWNGKRYFWQLTKGMGHGLLGFNLFDPNKKTNIICEGLWDGTALYEILSRAKPDTDDSGKFLGYIPTGSLSSSMLADKNVLAIATANSFKDSYRELFKETTVILMGQNDHARTNPVTGQVLPPVSHTEMGKISRLLQPVTTDQSYLTWEEGGCIEGYNLALPTGYDARDYLTDGYNPLDPLQNRIGSRLQRLEGLEGRILGLPQAFVIDDPSGSEEEEKKKTLQTKSCSSYQTLITSWRKALRWRQSLDDVLSVMLAVAASTQQVGDQLFCQVIGQPAGGKTKLCDAMLVSKHCYALEHLTGFYSGTQREDGKDCSLIARMNGKTIITPEGDVIMSSPNFISIMSEQRRIFDGTGGHAYKTDIEDKKYPGLRTPWIMAGTPAMMENDQSRLGDRFLKVFLDEPDDEEKRSILERCGHDALMSVMQTSNGEADKQLNPKQVEAYQLTGGYVDYLRNNVSSLLSNLAGNIDSEALVSYCSLLGEFTADLRARPDPEAHRKDLQACKEMGTRLTSQFVRLACCLAVVLNKTAIDAEVLRRVKKVAFDTARGLTFEILKFIRREEQEGRLGVEVRAVASHINKSDDKARTILRFMKDIQVLKYSEPPPINAIKQKPRWSMTSRMKAVYLKTVESK